MKKAKWIVVSKFTTRKEWEELCKELGNDPSDYDIGDFNEIEISIVRKDYEHGQKSYGWGSDDKIILFDSPDHDVTQEDIDLYQKIANTIADALNKKGL